MPASILTDPRYQHLLGLKNLSFIPLDDMGLQIFSHGELVQTVPASDAAAVLHELVARRFLETRKLKPWQRHS